MIVRNAAVFLSLLFLCGATHAAVFVQDAARVSGYGPTRVGYSLWYAGACAERIGATVGYVGRMPTAEALPDILQYARDSVPHLLAQCPQAQSIEVTAEGQPSRPRQFYHFVMQRGDNWAPKRVKLNTDLVSALIEEGYVPARGPQVLSHTAYVRHADGRFDAIYGKAFEGRLVATTVEKVMQEGAEPPRLSNYTVRGHWYELGDEKPTGQCEQSREGYPLWGSFSMNVIPWSNNINVQRKRCADHDVTAQSERGMLADMRIGEFDDFGLEPFKISKVLSDAFAASGEFAAAPDLAEFARTRQPLYESASLRLYAQRPELCTHRRFDAVYRVNSERRDSEFGGNYTRFIGQLLRGVANEHCNDPLTASVDNYSLGDNDDWDHMSFQFRPNRPSPFGGDENFLQLLDHNKGTRAQAHDAWLAANLLGPACTDGPFCGLPGGRYLNAIYRGDLDSVRQMDHLYVESLKAYLGGRMPTEAALGPFADLFGAVLDAEPVHLLRDAANKYLYSYAAWGEACLDPGAQAYTFEYTTPVVIETDMDGVTTRSGGEHYEATYTLNPEFFPLRDRIGSAYGAADSDNPWNRPAKSQVFLGIVEMKRAYGCRSNEVKQFERQLLAMTNRVLAEPGTVPPPDDQRPPVAEKTVADAFPPVPEAAAPATGQIARSAPVGLPEVAATISVETRRPPVETAPAAAAGPRATAPANAAIPRGGTNDAPAATGAPANTAAVSSMSAVERQQHMSREMQALQQSTMAEMNELNQWMQQATREATTSDERTRILGEYQSKIADLQRRAQTGMQEVRQKYQ